MKRFQNYQLARIFLLAFTFLGAGSGNVIGQSNDNRHPHFGFGNQWNYGIKFPSSSGYQPYGNGTTSAYGFEVHASIPVGIFNVTPAWSTTIPLRHQLLQNPNGSNIPGGYSLSVPYQNDQEFSYYLYGDDYEYDQATGWVTQNMIGSYFSLALRDNNGEVEIGSGLFRKIKKATVYIPIAYDEYAYLNSTGTEWDNYFYSDTYFEPNDKVDEIRKVSWTAPVMVNYCYHYGHLYSGFGVAWFTGKDSFLSFRYNMGFWF